MPTKRHQAVIFDLDGTLLDTLEDIANSMNAVLRRHGRPEHDTPVYKYFVGDGMETLVRKALPADQRGEETVATCLAEMRAEYGRRWADTTRPYPGIPELLTGLSLRGIKTAVLSNKPDDFTRLTVERFLASWRFEHVIGLTQGSPKKPDPEAALQIARALGAAPEDCLYLGDTGTDMRTASNAGMFAVGALWGFRTAEEMLADGALELIAQPWELLRLI